MRLAALSRKNNWELATVHEKNADITHENQIVMQRKVIFAKSVKYSFSISS